MEPKKELRIHTHHNPDTGYYHTYDETYCGCAECDDPVGIGYTERDSIKAYHEEKKLIETIKSEMNNEKYNKSYFNGRTISNKRG